MNKTNTTKAEALEQRIQMLWKRWRNEKSARERQRIRNMISVGEQQLERLEDREA